MQFHVPVLVSEVLESLIVRSDGVYCDATTGTGGHSLEILRRLGPGGRLLSVDQDPDALNTARARLGGQGDRVRFHRGSFSDLTSLLREEGLERIDGILADLGLNTWTLSRPESGQSYQIDVPLRMVVDPDLRETAAEYLARASESELVEIFRSFGDLRRARAYARRIVDLRRRRPIETTGDLVRAVSGRRALPEAELSRIFQAVRVQVSHEMQRLDELLERSAGWIRPGGRLVLVCYASHEDRRVKQWARAQGCAFQPLHKKPRVPDPVEIRQNRRARSARLRAFERVAE